MRFLLRCGGFAVWTVWLIDLWSCMDYWFVWCGFWFTTCVLGCCRFMLRLFLLVSDDADWFVKYDW